MSKIRIVARLRPFLAGESEDDLVTVQRESDGSSTVTVVNQRDQSQQTKFSCVYLYNSGPVYRLLHLQVLICVRTCFNAGANLSR